MSSSSPKFDCDVLIVGAGPVGMTLALALQRSSIDFRIIDRARDYSGESKAITVQPRTLEQLHLLGAAERMVAAGVRAGVMHMHDARKRMTTLRYDRLPTPFSYYLHLHQGETERLLADLLAERGVVIERGLALTRFGIDAHDCSVGVELVDDEGAARGLRCRYLVGCDGGHSRVRAGLGVEFSGERHGENWIMADVRIAGFDLPVDQRHGFMLETYPFVILPMSDGYFRVIAARSDDSPRKGQNPDLDEFATIARKLGFDYWRFEYPLWLTNYNPSQFIASRFRLGPVFLAGDAAHVNTPIAAQGLNTGVMDATNLAWKLSWALRHGAHKRLLDSYHEERHPAVLKMFNANNRLTRMVFGRNPLMRKLVRKQLRLLEFEPLNLRNTSGSSQLAVGYRSSPVILSGPARGLRAWLRRSLHAGDRAPCPALHDPRVGAAHLYDLLDPVRHTLLVFGAGTGELLAWAERTRLNHTGWLKVVRVNIDAISVDATTEVFDPDSTIASAYGLNTRSGAVLLRPDAFIAMHMDIFDDASLSRYLELLGSAPQLK